MNTKLRNRENLRGLMAALKESLKLYSFKADMTADKINTWL